MTVTWKGVIMHSKSFSNKPTKPQNDWKHNLPICEPVTLNLTWNFGSWAISGCKHSEYSGQDGGMKSCPRVQAEWIM